MSSTVEQIKDRLGILDVVSGYIKVEKAGKNYKARCPFHNEKTPSFFISPERESYYCFGCNAKGDIFSFVEQFEGVDFMGALKMLAERAGVEIERSVPSEKNPNAGLYDIVENARHFFVDQLEKNPDAQAYVASRGILPETVKTFSIGYASAEWRLLYDHLTRAGFKESDMLAAGLIKRKEGNEGAGGHPYDVFRSRIMFPVYDSSGRAVAFAGRLVGKEDEHAPKYLNSPETPIFKKSETLYGFDKAKGTIRKHDFSILVEGQIDLVMAHQSGFTNAIAVMGTAFTQAHASKIKRFSNNLAIALDGDSAGIASALRTSKISLASGMDVKIVALPDGKDPADLIVEDKDKWRECVRSAQHVIDFLLERLSKTETDSRKLKQKVQHEVFPFIAMIPNTIDRAHFIERSARVMNVDESLVAEEVGRVIPDMPAPSTNEGRPTVASIDITKHDRLLRTLIGIIMWLANSERSEESKKIGMEIERIIGADPMKVFDVDENAKAAFEAEVAYGGSAHLERYAEEMLTSLEEEVLKERFTELMERLARIERVGDEAGSFEVLKEYKDISKRLDELKNRKYIDN